MFSFCFLCENICENSKHEETLTAKTCSLGGLSAHCSTVIMFFLGTFHTFKSRLDLLTAVEIVLTGNDDEINLNGDGSEKPDEQAFTTARKTNCWLHSVDDDDVSSTNQASDCY
ncbi:hypothetical protein ACJX0J_041459 [Zea mays]